MNRHWTTIGVAGLVMAAAATASGQPVEVKMRGSRFNPANIEIEAGMTVRWVNDDFLPHTATSQAAHGTLTPDGHFGSGFMSAGATFEFTFDEAGEFFYYCEIHGSHMQGSILVVAACVVDLNEDGIVDFADYLEFLNLFEAEDPRVDFVPDGIIDFADYLEFLNLFDAGC